MSFAYINPTTFSVFEYLYMPYLKNYKNNFSSDSCIAPSIWLHSLSNAIFWFFLNVRHFLWYLFLIYDMNHYLWQVRISRLVLEKFAESKKIIIWKYFQYYLYLRNFQKVRWIKFTGHNVQNKKLVVLFCNAFIWYQNYIIFFFNCAGDHKSCEILVTECKEFKKTIDSMVGKANLASFLQSSSWAEQFKEAMTVEAGEEGEDDEGECEPTYGDYVMHYLSLFWKLLFAFVPPTDIWGGWACFIVAISWIGILTAVTGDIASHFGCTVGLADSVVAISFVALGTSLPGKICFLMV